MGTCLWRPPPWSTPAGRVDGADDACVQCGGDLSGEVPTLQQLGFAHGSGPGTPQCHRGDDGLTPTRRHWRNLCDSHLVLLVHEATDTRDAVVHPCRPCSGRATTLTALSSNVSRFAWETNSLQPEQTQGTVAYRPSGIGQDEARAFEAA